MDKLKTKIITQYKGAAENSKHIVVLKGGMSAEREVSFSSGSGTVKNLIELGYKVTSLDMGTDIAKYLLELQPDVVFNALHGPYGEDGCVSGLLEIMQIPYTHSGVLASALALDKIHSQDLFIKNGIKCPNRLIIDKKQNIKNDPMQRPYVIKPINQGSSIGVIVVFKEDDFDFASYDYPYGDQIIVENYISGKEINVAVLGNKAIGTMEIVCLKNRFYDYESKYTDGFADHIFPARLSAEDNKKALEISERVHNLIGCNCVSRVEFRFNEEEREFYLLEINSHPGLTPLSIVPDIAARNGINFKQLLQILIEEAEERFRKTHHEQINN